MVQESLKFILAISMLLISGGFKQAIEGWSITSWLKVAAFPAFLYSIQNICALLAYQNLDGVTFNVLNQTKTLSAALCCYFLMGRKQSRLQVLSLFLLLGSALTIEKIISIDFILGGWIESLGQGMTEESNTIPSLSNRHLTHGVVPVLLASFLSGLAGAISQKNLQTTSSPTKQNHATKTTSGRNPFLFSAELCIASILLLSLSLLASDDGTTIAENGFFHRWTVPMLIPIVTNAVGGIIVGLVTKTAGTVRKGFALIFGMLVTGLVQSGVEEEGGGVSKEQIVGGILAAVSLWMHATNPWIAGGGDKKVVKQE